MAAARNVTQESGAQESTPLLQHASDAEEATIFESPSPWTRYLSNRWPFTISRRASSTGNGKLLLMCLIPFIHFGSTLQTTPTLDILEFLICRAYYAGDAEHKPTLGGDALCNIPEIKTRFSALVTVLSILQGIGGD